MNWWSNETDGKDVGKSISRILTQWQKHTFLHTVVFVLFSLWSTHTHTQTQTQLVSHYQRLSSVLFVSDTHTHSFTSFLSLFLTYTHKSPNDFWPSVNTTSVVNWVLLMPLPVQTQKHSRVQSNVHSLPLLFLSDDPSPLFKRWNPKRLVQQQDWVI